MNNIPQLFFLFWQSRWGKTQIRMQRHHKKKIQNINYEEKKTTPPPRTHK